MPTPCLIRFTNNDGEGQAYVFRKQHGHPEQVVSNLASLKTAIERQGNEPSSDNIAARFIFLDTLWYALRETTINELEEELWSILFAPTQAATEGPDSYLNQHAILDSTSPIEAVSFLYEVKMGEPDWDVKIGHNSESVEGPVEEVFQVVSWGFSGELSEAIGRFQ